MATGVFRPDTVESARAAAGRPAPVGGGRGTAVNIVGQPIGLRPGTTAPPSTGPRMTQYGPALPYGQGGINEIGSSGRTPIGFYTGQPGTTLARSLDPMVIWGSNQQGGGTPTAPVIPSGGGQGGGDSGAGGGGGMGGGGMGGGMGGGGGFTPPAAQTSAVWDQLLKALADITAGARGQIGTAGEQLKGALTSRDPEASFQWNPASVVIPQATLANYVQAVGGSPTEVQATRDLGQQFLNAFLGDVGQVAQGADVASQNWRVRQQDVGSQLQADALRQLAFNEMAARLGIEQARAAEQRDIQNTALEMALKYAEAERKKRDLAVTAPSLPFNAVTIPGYGSITLPQTLV